MKILTIGQDNFSIPNMDGYEVDCYLPTDSLPDVIKYVQESNADIIFIQAEQPAPESDLYGGLELLIWLRIKGVNTHIVLVSFFSLEALMKNTKNAFILGAEGTTFCQMPFIPYSAELTELSKNLSKDDNLKTYLSSIFDFVHFRHAYANVWGLKRLVEVHKVFYPHFDNSQISYGDVLNSLNYIIGEFIYHRSELNINNQIRKNIESAIDNLQIEIRKASDLNILFIDDKAETGWKILLESLLKVRINTLSIKNINSDNLIKQFEELYSKQEIDVIISDLRLYPSEDDLTDYNQFKSIELLKYIFDKKIERKLVYKNLRYVLFTASNQLLNYKNVVKSNKYTPSGIFIKEGFDVNINENQQEQNYLNLINATLPAIAESYNKKGARIETIEESEIDKIKLVENALESNAWSENILKIKQELDKYDFVFLDTNTYLNQKPLIALSGSSKVKYLYPVYKEIERIISTRESTYRVFIGDLIQKRYCQVATKLGLSSNMIFEIDQKFVEGTGLKDLADGYFLPIIQSIKTDDINRNKSILFITNDKKEDSPYVNVKNWIAKNQMSDINVFSSAEFYKAHNIDLYGNNRRSNNNGNQPIKFKNYDYIKKSSDGKYLLLKQRGVREHMCVHIDNNELGKFISDKGFQVLDNYDINSISKDPYPKWSKIENYNYLKISFKRILKLISN